MDYEMQKLEEWKENMRTTLKRANLAVTELEDNLKRVDAYQWLDVATGYVTEAQQYAARVEGAAHRARAKFPTDLMSDLKELEARFYRSGAQVALQEASTHVRTAQDALVVHNPDTARDHLESALGWLSKERAYNAKLRQPNTSG